MENTSRRKFLAGTTMASLGILGGFKSVLANNSRETGQNFSTAKRPSGLAKSKRDLMMQVLDMSTTPNYIPAGFFMHFGVKGDAAVKAHLDYFCASGMDFVKIQYEQSYKPLDFLRKPDDWAKLLPNRLDFYAPQLEAVREIVKAAKKEAADAEKRKNKPVFM